MNTKFWGGGGGVGVSGGVGNYNFPRSTNKIKSFDKILTSEKNYYLYFFAFFCYGGGLNLILGQVWKTKYSKNSSCYQVFSSNSQKLSLWCKKKSLSMQMDLYDPYKSPHTIS